MEPVIHSTHQLRKRNSPRVNLTISLILHVLLFAAGAYWAAHEGILGKKIQELSLMLVPKEKKEEAKKDEPKIEEKKVETKPAETEKVAAAPVQKLVAPPPPVIDTSIAAPPPVVDQSFVWVDPDPAKDPKNIYAGQIEKSIRLRWERPKDLEDVDYAAEVELTLDSSGKILAFDWKKGSGNRSWDESVKLALANTTSVGAPPPKDFPNKFRVRFDVQAASEQLLSKSE